MTVRSVLVPVHGADSDSATLGTAFGLARDLGCHVNALHVRVDPTDAIPMLGEGMSGTLVQDLVDVTTRETSVRARRAKDFFDAAVESAGLNLAETPSAAGASAWYTEIAGREDDLIVNAGRLVDLIVVGRPARAPEAPVGPTLNVILFETGRPVLVSPRDARPRVAGHVAIAWNASAEAARAVGAALPFLARAERVTIVSVGGERAADDPCAGVARYLAWHGIDADDQVVLGHRSVGEALYEVCGDADLVVMGAYTHSRLRELILGGTTRFMIEETDLPLLMAH
jgi:nucleotide-binding universal stress UspA family protein